MKKLEVGMKVYKVDTTRTGRPVLCTFELKQIRRVPGGRRRAACHKAFFVRVDPPVPESPLPLSHTEDGLSAAESFTVREGDASPLAAWLSRTPEKALDVALLEAQCEERDAFREHLRKEKTLERLKAFVHREKVKRTPNTPKQTP